MGLLKSLAGIAKKHVNIGFGGKEFGGSATGIVVAGGGASAYIVLQTLGWIPAALQEPLVQPYVVSALGAGVEVIRQFLKNNNISVG
tara:strand:- start:5813 stop:6073 length:261 start_codon:yes stop_codon:yes gene_type:complete